MSVIPSVFCVCAHVVPMCPDKVTTKSRTDAATVPDGHFPNKEKLHVLWDHTQGMSLIVILHNVLWVFCKGK